MLSIISCICEKDVVIVNGAKEGGHNQSYLLLLHRTEYQLNLQIQCNDL